MSGRRTRISGWAALLWMKLPTVLSQCLGNSLFSTKRTQTEQDREKGMLEYAEENPGIRDYYRAGKLKQCNTMNKKIYIIKKKYIRHHQASQMLQ